MNQNQLIEAILEHSDRKEYARHAFLLREGQVENHVYIILSGAIRAFLIQDEAEMTIRFGYEGSLINSLASFLKAEPSQLYLQAIRKTTVAVITRARLQELISSNPDYLLAYTKLLEHALAEQIEREIDLLNDAPRQRFQRILARSPQLFQAIPLRYIANYLRMSPETLSRLRKS